MMNWIRRAGGRRKVSWLFGNAKIFTFDGNLDGNFFLCTGELRGQGDCDGKAELG